MTEQRAGHVRVEGDSLPEEPGRSTALGREAFADLSEPHRRELLVHCYRLLGSLHDAEDLVQETMLRAWRGRSTFDGRGTLRAWLYRIATNAFLDQRRSRRALPEKAPGAGEGFPLEPFPDALLPEEEGQHPETHAALMDSVRLAFLRAVHEIPPRQRAVLLLSDVMAFRAHEVAGILGTSASAVNSLLHRARRRMSRTHPVEDAAAGGRGTDPRIEDLVGRFMRAWERSDVDALVGLLRDDATFTMPPVPGVFRGPGAIRGLCVDRVFLPEVRWRLIATAANGGPATALYRAEGSAPARLVGIALVAARPDGISEVATFMDPSLAEPFGIPAQLSPAHAT